MDDDPAVSWVDNSNEQRYELLLDGVRAGLTTYTLGPGEITYLHTEIDPEYQGRGLAGWLAAAVLDDARRRDLVVRPRCPFIRSYIARHAEYADLVAPGFDPHAG